MYFLLGIIWFLYQNLDLEEGGAHLILDYSVDIDMISIIDDIYSVTTCETQSHPLQSERCSHHLVENYTHFDSRGCL